jgi:hypothetical protein
VGGNVPLDEVLVVLFGKDCAGVVDAGTVVFVPDVGYLCGWFPLDHGDLHDFSEFARTGVGEGHFEGDSQQHLYGLIKY